MQPIEAAQNFETEKVLHGSHMIPSCIVGVQWHSDIGLFLFFLLTYK